MRQLAVMKNVTLGVNDRGNVSLSFTVYIEEHIAATQEIGGNELFVFIKAYDVSDVKLLNGKVCWVDNDGYYIRNPKPAKM